VGRVKGDVLRAMPWNGDAIIRVIKGGNACLENISLNKGGEEDRIGSRRRDTATRGQQSGNLLERASKKAALRAEHVQRGDPKGKDLTSKKVGKELGKARQWRKENSRRFSGQGDFKDGGGGGGLG